MNSQQPTANSQQPTANSQQPTANSQQPTANSQQPTANSQQPTANSQQPTANSQQPTANSQQPTANSQQPTANSQQPTANITGGKVMGSWHYVPLGEVCEINPRRDLAPEPATGTLMTFVPMPALNERTGTITQPEIKPYEAVRKGYTFFREGDVLFAKITPCMQNGKHAVARQLRQGIGFGSTEFHVLRPSNKVLAEWIHLFLRQPSILNKAMAHFEGSVGQQRVPTSFLINLQIPLPTIAEQHQLIARLQMQLAAADEARQVAEAQLVSLRQLPASLLRNTFEPVLT